MRVYGAFFETIKTTSIHGRTDEKTLKIKEIEIYIEINVIFSNGECDKSDLTGFWLGIIFVGFVFV